VWVKRLAPYNKNDMMILCSFKSGQSYDYKYIKNYFVSVH
jgi:hypothetical protein